MGEGGVMGGGSWEKGGIMGKGGSWEKGGS